jgi:hypothetical protein
MATRDPRRRTHVASEEVAEHSTVPVATEQDVAADPAAAAPGIPIARPDPSKPYPEGSDAPVVEDTAAVKE